MYGTAAHMPAAMTAPSCGSEQSANTTTATNGNQLKMSNLRISNATPRGFSTGVYSSNKKFGSVAAPKAKQKVSDEAAPQLPQPPPYMSPAAPYTSSYTGCETDADLLPPPPPELYSDVLECSGADLPAPPSPVSSSYSELRRVNRDPPPPLYPESVPQGVAFKGGNRVYPGSKAMDQQSIHSVGGATAHVGGATAIGGVASGAASNQIAPPTADFDSELDSMTQNLMARIENPQDDIHGLCGKCGASVKGEGGCTAMGRVYHTGCFCCCRCDAALSNQRFYVVDSRPHCHTCYLATLEKCSVCHEPITDRLLRATGKPYHPRCFVCVQCGKCLDGVSFTVDATNQTYCIEDFHQKFAPRCSRCSLPIIPQPGQDETVRVVALDRSFHVDCYSCEDCGLVLSSEAEGRGCFPLDGHVLCKSCNAARVRKMTSR